MLEMLMRRRTKRACIKASMEADNHDQATLKRTLL
jgi:hypothetical protein